MDDYRSVTCFPWVKISLFCPFPSSLLVFVLLIEPPGVFVRHPSGLTDEDTMSLLMTRLVRILFFF